jgi:hypothetical protein
LVPPFLLLAKAGWFCGNERGQEEGLLFTGHGGKIMFTGEVRKEGSDLKNMGNVTKSGDKVFAQGVKEKMLCY